MKKPTELDQRTFWHFQFVWSFPPACSGPPEVALGCLAVAGEEHVADCRSVCGGCLLLMLFDILAGVLSAWLLQLLWYLERRLSLGSCQCPLLLVSLPISCHLARSMPRSPFLISKIKTSGAGVWWQQNCKFIDLQFQLKATVDSTISKSYKTVDASLWKIRPWLYICTRQGHKSSK